MCEAVMSEHIFFFEFSLFSLSILGGCDSSGDRRHDCWGSKVFSYRCAPTDPTKPLWIKKKTRGKGAQGKNGGPHGSTEKLVFSESNT